MIPQPRQDAIESFTAIVGPANVFAGDAEVAPFCQDWRGLVHTSAAAVVRPRDTEEMAAVVRLCARLGIHVVPQGGNTGAVAGALPIGHGQEVVVNLSRMNRIRAVDPLDMTITVDAGVTLRAVQDAAAAAACSFPLSIGSEGTAQIGGIVSTNAGGNTTVRYGNARDQVLGLECVLADGSVWNGLRRLRKDNTGYCLRHLFMGAEGTLGIVTGAVLKLQGRRLGREVAFCAVPDPAAVLALLGRLQAADASALQAFEYMGRAGVDLVLRHMPGTQFPLTEAADHYVLLEFASGVDDGSLRTRLEELLGTAHEDGLVGDVVLAASEAQRQAMWAIREGHAPAQQREGVSLKHDVSVPVSAVPDLLRQATAACTSRAPGCRIVAFGHVGDGNIHFNVQQPAGTDPAAFLRHGATLGEAVHGIVRELDGSFSAEHGVGQLKPGLMPGWRGGVELELMRRIKQAFDPDGLMNPGKVLP